MSNNCLVKTATNLVEMFLRCLKDSFFANLDSVCQKRWLGILKRHLRSFSKTLLRQLKKSFLRDLKDSCFANLTNVWANHYLDNLTYIWKLSRTNLRVSSNLFLWNSGLLLSAFCNFFMIFHPNSCHFPESRFLLTHKIEFL